MHVDTCTCRQEHCSVWKNLQLVCGTLECQVLQKLAMSAIQFFEPVRSTNKQMDRQTYRQTDICDHTVWASKDIKQYSLHLSQY